LTSATHRHRINAALYKRPLFQSAVGLASRPRRQPPAGGLTIPSPARIRGTLVAWAVRPEDLSELRTFHKALADINRLRIVQRLAGAPATVTELIDHVGLSQPLVSHHLRRLREAGIVEARRNGRETVCFLRPEAFEEVNARERAILGYDGASSRAADVPEAALTAVASATPAAAAPATRPAPARPAVETTP
jgi:ArsR family transcriptional regulator, arsenate/arsenite/antimonite-responsive transcriptional repressor